MRTTRTERLAWSALMLFIGGMSGAVILWADVPIWFATIVLAAWIIVFVQLWPEVDDADTR